jgi:TetR/AcrR family transcriptional regulator
MTGTARGGSSGSSGSSGSNGKKTRRVQQRALDTRDALLDTAIECFSRQGYDGVSVRRIEEQAGVNRGLVAYHFADKAALWRHAVDRLFASMRRALRQAVDAADGADEGALAEALARAFVRYSAEKPALNRLMIQESLQASWRVEYLVDRQIRPMMDALQRDLPAATRAVWGDRDAHRYYAFIGAAAFVFSAAEECKLLFGTSPAEETFIEEHAEIVLRLLLR